MKKLLFAFLIIGSFTGCSLDDDSEDLRQLDVLVPIESVEIPDSFVLGETHDITIVFSKPTQCHKATGVQHQEDGQTQYIGIVSTYNPDDPLCTEEEGLTEEITIGFIAERNDLYIFKFWQGVDENDEPIYLTVEVPVSEE